MATPRPTKSGRRSARQSEVQKQLWQIPEHREKMLTARARSAVDRRKDPKKYSRIGVPNGMRKAEAQKAWAAAGELADTIMRGFEALSIVPEEVIPDTDEALAKAALREACVLALGPGSHRTKLAAAVIVLRFTRVPPAACVRASTPPSAQAWLKDAIVASSADAPMHDTSSMPTHDTTTTMSPAIS
jgi:hypothetical protein